MDYAYVATVAPGDVFTELEIGMPGPCQSITDIVATDNFGVILDGWDWEMVSVESYEDQEDWYPAKTPHGFFSPGPTALTPWRLTWEGPALSVGVYWFGFNSPCHSVDVGWSAGVQVNPNEENWDMPVGLGLGPVHAPIPEPLSVALMGVGAAVIGLRRRISKS